MVWHRGDLLKFSGKIIWLDPSMVPVLTMQFIQTGCRCGIIAVLEKKLVLGTHLEESEILPMACAEKHSVPINLEQTTSPNMGPLDIFERVHDLKTAVIEYSLIRCSTYEPNHLVAARK